MHPRLEWLVDSNVKWLGESGASTGDVDDFNAELGDGVSDRCHHVASVRIEEDDRHDAGRGQVDFKVRLEDLVDPPKHAHLVHPGGVLAGVQRLRVVVLKLPRRDMTHCLALVNHHRVKKIACRSARQRTRRTPSV